MDVGDWVSHVAHGLVYGKPPKGASYGYRWQRGQGVPAKLNIYDTRNLPPGLYVTFTGVALDPTTDLFGRIARCGPVFEPPKAVSAALSNLVATVASDPPDGEAWWLSPVKGRLLGRLLDVDGYLSYVARCLGLIDQTEAGQQLLTDLGAIPAKATVIRPGPVNASRGGSDTGVTTLTKGLTRYKRRQGLIPSETIDAAVTARYGGNGQAQYDQFAADMNAAPLYTCYAEAAFFQQAYLRTSFRYNGNPLSGIDLRAWAGGSHIMFEKALRDMKRGPDYVVPLEFFLLVIGITLLRGAQAGPGNRTVVEFSTRDFGINNRKNPRFRPPAIGLAHELIHAWHYTRGLSPGYESDSYCTTAAELKFSGIGPFAGDKLTENAVRAEWDYVASPDPSNVWDAPDARLVYEPVPPGWTIAQTRKEYKSI